MQAIIVTGGKQYNVSEGDELFIEKNKYNCYWVHFAVRPKDNRRKISFLNG